MLKLKLFGILAANDVILSVTFTEMTMSLIAKVGEIEQEDAGVLSPTYA